MVAVLGVRSGKVRQSLKHVVAVVVVVLGVQAGKLFFVCRRGRALLFLGATCPSFTACNASRMA